MPPVSQSAFCKEGTNHPVCLSGILLDQKRLVGKSSLIAPIQKLEMSQENDQRSSSDVLPSSYDQVPVLGIAIELLTLLKVGTSTIRFYRSKKRDRSLYMWSVNKISFAKTELLLAASISSSLTSKGPASRPLTPIRSLKGPKIGESFSSLQTSVKGFRYCSSRL